MDYLELDIQCQEHLKEIITAELLQLGYESFMDTAEGLKAYRSQLTYDQEELRQMLARYPQIKGYQWQQIAEQNWNHAWESSFKPIVIDKSCRIRASFHEPSSDYHYEIVIDPKMSFGTGHHETTSQMIRRQLLVDHRGKKVLDVGCGTGILSILAEKLGSTDIMALDIDKWAVENTRENLMLNDCGNIRILEGSVHNLGQQKDFDIILANINRNVLLEEIPQYALLMAAAGCLIISGFYTEDQPPIVKTCETNGLQVQAQNAENNWACVLLRKN